MSKNVTLAILSFLVYSKYGLIISFEITGLNQGSVLNIQLDSIVSIVAIWNHDGAKLSSGKNTWPKEEKIEGFIHKEMHRSSARAIISKPRVELCMC